MLLIINIVKKVLKTILILILIGGFALFIFWLINPGQAPIQNNFISKVREFNPFSGTGNILGDNFDSTPGVFEGGEEISEEERERILPNIEMVYSSPVGGYTVLGSGASTTVRVVDRATGHIIDIDTRTKEQVRISNTTLPGIIEAIWFNEGKGVIMRYLRESSDVIETLVISNLSTTGGETAGTYLEENISSIKPISNTEMAYIVPSGFGSNIKVYDTQKNTSAQVYNSTLQEIMVVGGNRNNIFVQTKASYASPGYLYAVSRKNNSITKVLNGINGFNVLLSPDTSTILATTGGDSPFSYIYDQNLGTTNVVDVNTVSSKCVFARKTTEVHCGVPTRFPDNMPDSWYMGLTPRADQIWEISSEGNLTFVTGLQNIDVIKPQLSEDDGQLFFVNKNNGSVWVVRLTQL